MTNLEMEKEKLKSVQKMYQDLIFDYEAKMRNVAKVYKNDPIMQENLLNQFGSKVRMLNKYIDNPYFGRIDFKNEYNKKDICYIGKIGILDSNENPITVDWRAPISSLYYDSNVGECEYKSPSGVIKGTLELKRQFEIKMGALISFQDVNAISNDELLKPYLSVSADKRLKNIVATIQSEQNHIIRKDLRENNIIQGTAGSGKTTVALHRIAYLVYNEQKNYQESAFLVIGPNAYFMDYISSVLPDLEVNSVSQYTFLDIVNNYLGEKIKIIDQNMRIESILNNNLNTKIIKYKSSLKYKDAIKKYIKELEENIIHGPIKYKGITLFDEKVIKDYLSKKDLGINNAIKLLIKYGKSYIKNYGDDIKYRYWLKYKDEYLNSTDQIRKQEILDITENFNKEIMHIDKIINEYFKDYNLKILELYKNFINNCEKYIDADDCDTEILKKSTLESINKKALGYEDLPALIHLNLKFQGYKNYDKFVHVVVDEAQDFGLYHFYVIKKLFKNSTFSIFGDLAQSIYSYQSIDDWESVIDKIFASDCNLDWLNKSYRTTCEIMASANIVSKYFGYGDAKAVLRHGNSVLLNKVNDKDKINYLINKINYFKENDYKSIAIICKDEKESANIYKLIKNNNLDIDLITNKNTKYNGGICILPSYLSKGLEFDAVIISDLDNYDNKSMLDMKLLYVSMTRALHELIITYQKESELVNKLSTK